MGFAAVARVTEDRWVACSVLHEIDLGLEAGGELTLETTICHEIRQSREAVVIDNVAEDRIYCKHATPAMDGFQSYISVPIVLANGSFFGTLCAIDPHPAHLKTPETVGMFRLFAELIAKHLDAAQKLAASESALNRASRFVLTTMRQLPVLSVSEIASCAASVCTHPPGLRRS
jgi:GAF domain-containing protein